MTRFSPWRTAIFAGIASFCVLGIHAFAQSTSAKTKQPAGVGVAVYPLQSIVAAHSSFPTVPASSAAVRQALPAVNVPAGAKVNGKAVTVQGTVLRTVAGSTNDVVILSFAPNFRSQLAVRVSYQNYSKFPDLAALTGKRVLVTGTVTHATKWPQLEVTKPGQIRIVQ